MIRNRHKKLGNFCSVVNLFLDPYPELLKSRSWIRFRNKSFRIHNTGAGWQFSRPANFPGLQISVSLQKCPHFNLTKCRNQAQQACCRDVVSSQMSINYIIRSSVVDPYTLYLDPDPEICPRFESGSAPFTHLLDTFWKMWILF